MSQAKKKNFKIEPFKHKVEMDPKYAEKTWKILEDAIHEIYNHNASGLSFEELYRYEKRERERDRLLFFAIRCVYWRNQRRFSFLPALPVFQLRLFWTGPDLFGCSCFYLVIFPGMAKFCWRLC